MNYTRCKKCLIPDTRPDTPFVDGVCSACISHEKRKSIDWAEREKQLLKILEKAPRNGTGYDCIVPSSGGKDSHWQVLKLIELGARPLVVTATTCHLTSLGRKNIDNLARYATTMEVSPNKEVRAKLNRAGLEMVGDISWPEHCAIFTTPFRVACQTGIPLIFYGENPQEAYGGPPGTEEAKQMTQRWVSEFGGFLGLRPADLVGYSGIGVMDMLDYAPPRKTQIEKIGVTAYFLGQFYEWDSRRNACVAINKGMKCPQGNLPPTTGSYWKFENLDNAQTGIHDYVMYLKYGYGRCCAQLSVDIRNGFFSREEGVDRLGDDGYMPTKYLDVYLEEIINKIGISFKELFYTFDRFTNWDLFRRTNDDFTAPLMRLFE